MKQVVSRTIEAGFRGSRGLTRGFQIYGRVDNIFDNRYATYGTIFDTGGGS